jgi:hypothetical protein
MAAPVRALSLPNAAILRPRKLQVLKPIAVNWMNGAAISQHVEIVITPLPGRAAC